LSLSCKIIRKKGGLWYQKNKEKEVSPWVLLELKKMSWNLFFRKVQYLEGMEGFFCLLSVVFALCAPVIIYTEDAMQEMVMLPTQYNVMLLDIQERGYMFMFKEMNRREFLKASAVTGGLLISADFFGNRIPVAYGSVKIPEAERITITIIEDNYYDFFRPDSKIAKRYRGNIYSEAGLACHIETVVDGRPHSFLFDFGRTFHAVSRNIDTLKIDFDKLEALALSHGHRDHFGSLVELLKSRREKIPKGIPLYVGEEAFAERGGVRPDLVTVTVVHHLKKEDIEGLGFVKVVEIKDPTPIVPGAYLTGRIERVTDYEKGLPGASVKRGDKFEQDDFIGEQSVLLNLKGKGLVVLTGCAHAGVVNTVKHAQKITGVGKVHAIMGGFHLTGAKEELIQRTVGDNKAMAPDYIIPMHCTGFEAFVAFAKEMPDQFVLNTSGTRYTFSL
jgi:7,8-dihydropterin-6-yl-methyl-4-(beta-D-ribofuranosyl)aminobenzene 5'-phosphate synthase